MKLTVPQWIAPAVVVAGIATVVIAAPLAQNHPVDHPRMATMYSTDPGPSAPGACHNDCGLNDDWSYAGQVNSHPGCWQLTLTPDVAEFQCGDGQRFTLEAR